MPAPLRTTLVAVLLAAAASAEDAPRRTPYLSGEAGVDVVSKYFYRGILNEETGLIVQPYAMAECTVLEGWGRIDRVHVDGTIWNSLHSGPSTDEATGSPAWWYEADGYVGVGVTAFGGLDLTATYAWLWSPSRAFDRQEELQFTLSYEDEWEDVRVFDRRFLGFLPEVTLALETLRQSDGGRHRGTCLEVGISPTFALLEEDEPSLELAFTLKTGWSLGDYYEDEEGADHPFGYFEVGAAFTYTFDGEDAGAPGAWDLVMGGSVLFLGPSTTEYAEGEDVQGVGYVGVHVRF